MATEAMECLGGNGYVEDGPLARLYREAPLNGIWEGSANVICLDALRAIARSPRALQALRSEIAAGREPRADALADGAAQLLRAGEGAERDARRIVEAFALAVQASLMRRYSDPAAADAFCGARLHAAAMFGTLEGKVDTGALLRRAMRE